MKQYLRKLLPRWRPWRPAPAVPASPALDLAAIARLMIPPPDLRAAVDKAAQILLLLQYRDLVRQGKPLPTLQEVEFHTQSQNGEDGILLFLFAVVGAVDRRCVEVCAGDGIENNTANLVINHGWRGLMFDGSETNIAKGQRFYARRRDGLKFYGPRLVQAWITRDRINDLIAEQGFTGEIDLLSIDLDGNDYWIWQALEVVQPRVVVVEYNAGLGLSKAVTIPYRDDFVYDWNAPFFGGASLPAFTKLGQSKGYRLVGTDQYGINAFFIRKDIAADLLPEIPASAGTGRWPTEPDWERYPFVTV